MIFSWNQCLGEAGQVTLTDYYSMKDRYKGAIEAKEWRKKRTDYRGTTLPNSLRGGQ